MYLSYLLLERLIIDLKLIWRRVKGDEYGETAMLIIENVLIFIVYKLPKIICLLDLLIKSVVMMSR